jgi:hypothetical protein
MRVLSWAISLVFLSSSWNSYAAEEAAFKISRLEELKETIDDYNDYRTIDDRMAAEVASLMSSEKSREALGVFSKALEGTVLPKAYLTKDEKIGFEGMPYSMSIEDQSDGKVRVDFNGSTLLTSPDKILDELIRAQSLPGFAKRKENALRNSVSAGIEIAFLKRVIDGMIPSAQGGPRVKRGESGQEGGQPNPSAAAAAAAVQPSRSPSSGSRSTRVNYYLDQRTNKSYVYYNGGYWDYDPYRNVMLARAVVDMGRLVPRVLNFDAKVVAEVAHVAFQAGGEVAHQAGNLVNSGGGVLESLGSVIGAAAEVHPLVAVGIAAVIGVGLPLIAGGVSYYHHYKRALVRGQIQSLLQVCQNSNPPALAAQQYSWAQIQKRAAKYGLCNPKKPQSRSCNLMQQAGRCMNPAAGKGQPSGAAIYNGNGDNRQDLFPPGYDSHPAGGSGEPSQSGQAR